MSDLHERFPGLHPRTLAPLEPKPAAAKVDAPAAPAPPPAVVPPVREAESGKPGTNHTQIDPASKKKLAGLVRHYMKQAKPFTACVRDNTRRFGPDGAKRVCAVLKDVGHGSTRWRSQEDVPDLVVDAHVRALIEAAGPGATAETVELVLREALDAAGAPPLS